LTGALFVLTPAHADTVWDFTSGGVNVDLGTSHNFVGSGGGATITATAFGPNSPHLFSKNEGVGEIGLGLTNDPSGQNEITNGSFIQLNISTVPFLNFGMSFQANSVSGGEIVQVFGSNTSGVLGGTLLFSCNSAVQNNCNNLFPTSTSTINATGFSFLDVTAAPAGANVLLVELNAVPGPIVGAGLPGLLAACGGLLALARRRRARVA
jgi:hypothetical protein